MKIFKNLLCLFLTVLVLLPFTTAGSSAELTETTIIVVEGKVICFDIPHEFYGLIYTKETQVGRFTERVSEYSGWTEVKRQKNLCYIPEKYRQQIKDKLQPGTFVFLVRNIRQTYKTEWDLIAIGNTVTGGNEYTKGITNLTEPPGITFTPPAMPEEMEEFTKEPGDGSDTEPPLPPEPPTPPPEPEPPPDPDAPRASFTATPTIGPVPLTVNFDASASSDPDSSISSYNWDFGDGNTGTGVTVSNIFTTGGTYTVSLTVTDDQGLSDTATTTITAGDATDYYYVDPLSGDNTNDGSFSRPWRTITYALANADASVTNTIYLVPGATFSSEETFPLNMPDRFTLRSSNSSNNSIISGDNTNSVFSCNGVKASLGYLTIQNGQSSIGGGLTIANGSEIDLISCTISNNTADVSGGGIASASSSLTLSNCTISNNTATNSNGGGIWTTDTELLIDGGSFSGNSALNAMGGALDWTGDGTQSLNISRDTTSGTNPEFTNNQAAYGGGISVRNTVSGSATISSCTIDNNTATFTGGGIDVSDDANTTIQNCIITNNSSASGGAISIDSNYYSVKNCTIVDNSASTRGGGILYGNGSVGNSFIESNILIGNTNYAIFDGMGTDSFPTIKANDLWNNNNPQANINGTDYNSAAAMDTGSSNAFDDIGVDPVFKGTGANPYSLSAGSPTGTTGVVDNSNVIGAPSTDYRGQSRPGNPSDDIGCYEYVTGDPPITGRIYDAVTGKNIASPVVAIYDAGSNAQLGVTTDNPYTFNVTPGRYYIAVAKDDYGFPSQLITSTTSGDHGDIFSAVNDPLTIDIPVDPDGWLYLEKQVNKKRAEQGEIVTYHLKIQNKNWFKAIDNVELIDEITNGFKYISGSSYSDSAKHTDPTITNHKAIFDLGTVSANSTTNLSYQVRVGSALPEGRYKAAAHTRKSTTGERNSNISITETEVVNDPLFTRGTIIGKVFWDPDGNGRQDKNELGIPDVRIVTEYGVVIETDPDGKYHIADVPPGNHLLKVDTTILPAKARVTTDNPYYVKITEGLLAKVNFGISRNIAEPSTDVKDAEQTEPEETPVKNLLDKFFIVALGEGTVRNLNSSGNLDMVNKNDSYDDGVHVDGRLAFYLKGKVLGKYLITASVDTDRRPDCKYNSRRLFTNLDPDKYYPVYGDASRVDYSGVNTQDVAYVLIEWNESFAQWGSFHTEFPLYERSLSGGVINYNSIGKTKFGDTKTEIKGFTAFSRQKPAHDEFVGTGGSLYYLRKNNIIEGSEKLSVEVRDRLDKSTLNTMPLAEEIDYEIDYDSGRILLKKPLNGVQQLYSGSIISNDILMGESVYLVVDYEYYAEGLSEQAHGIKAGQWLGNHIRVGGTYVQEQKTGNPYKLMQGETTFKLNHNTSITGSYSRTEETQLSSGMSYDGGLTFDQQGENYSLGKSGSAVSIDGQTRLFGNTDIFLSYSREDPFYSVTNAINSQGSQKYDASIVSKLTEHLSAGIRHVTQRYQKGSMAGSLIAARDVHTTIAMLDYRKDKWDLRGEFQHQTVNNPLIDYTYFGTLPLVNNNFIAARVGYQLFSWLHPYLRGQATLSGETNNQGSLGADVNIGKNTALNIVETVGTLGNSTLVGLTTKISEGSNAYANITVGNDMRLGKYSKTTYGQSSILSPGSRVYVEQDYSSYRENLVRGNILGYEKTISETLALGLTYERSNLKNITRAIDRDAGSISLSYLNPDFLYGTEAFSKLELRNDKGMGTTEVRQWVTENDLLCRLTEGFTVSGRGNWGWTEDRSRNIDEAEFYELGAGFSFRPVSWDRFNLLGKYSYLTDLPPDPQWDFPEQTESRKHVYATEGIFDLCRYIQLVGKFAYRAMKEKVGARGWTHSDTYLYLGRSNFHVMNSKPDKPFLLRGWDFAVEYRILTSDQIEDSKKGFLVELDKDIGNYIRCGVGYNFTDYDDDLRNDDNWDAKGWFVRLSGKY